MVVFSDSGLHVSKKSRSSLIGTARFASIAAHQKLEQSRKDDLESLGYSMVFLSKGSLPWMELETIEFEERIEKIRVMKESISSEELCKNLPNEFCLYFDYIKKLNFTERPSYSHLRKLIANMMKDGNIDYDYQYDWIKIEKDKLILPSIFLTICQDLQYRIVKQKTDIRNFPANCDDLTKKNSYNIVDDKCKILLQAPGPPTIRLPIRFSSKITSFRAFSQVQNGSDTKSLFQVTNNLSNFEKTNSRMCPTSNLDATTDQKVKRTSLFASFNPKSTINPQDFYADSSSSAGKTLTSIQSLTNKGDLANNFSNNDSMEEEPDLDVKMASLAIPSKFSKANSASISQLRINTSNISPAPASEPRRRRVPHSPPLPPR
jgi:hypothetical protein